MKSLKFLSVALVGALLVLSACEKGKSSEPKNVTSVTDCQGHTYPVVKIGEQFWMAENLQCTQYDTKSSRPGVVIEKYSGETANAIYVDGRDTKSDFLFMPQGTRPKLGLLYNWAAAMGLESYDVIYSNIVREKWQGICPNGWHIPTIDEWDELCSYCGGSQIAGKKLKAKSPWTCYYKTYYKEGTDDYGFSALPAGYALDGRSIMDFVSSAQFMSATSGRESSSCLTTKEKTSFSQLGETMPPIDPASYCNAVYLSAESDAAISTYSDRKDAISVRCVMN